MASPRVRREADLFWRDLVGRARSGESAPAMMGREKADLFLDGLRGREVPFEEIGEGETKKASVVRELPTLTAAIAAGTALFELLPWYAEWKDPADESRNVWGFFWMFSDALMVGQRQKLAAFVSQALAAATPARFWLDAPQPCNRTTGSPCPSNW